MKITTEEKIVGFARQINVTLTEKIRLLKKQKSDARLIVLTRYISVFHPHFIVWVSAMQNSCVSAVGNFAANDNIFVELTENHQKMLWDFMNQLNITPSIEEYEKLLPSINAINEIMVFGVKNKMGIGPASVIYLLEESSKIFIPWIGEVAKNHQATDMTYIEKHGEADTNHANLARTAIIEEAKIKPEINDEISIAALAVGQLLDYIFH